MVAVASMVIFLSLGEGLRRVFASELGNIGPDLQISLNGFDGGGFAPEPNLPGSTLDQVNALREQYGIKQVIPVALSVRGGLDPSSSYILYALPAALGVKAVFPNVTVASGRLLQPADEGQPVAVVGASAAKNGNLKVGSTLRVNRRSAVKVVGVLDEGGGLTDSFILMPLTTLQDAIAAQGRLSIIALKLNEPTRAREVAKELSAKLQLEVQTQADFLNFVERALRISDAVRFGISLIALIVGGLAVANTVMMGVFERTREFGTLRAIGAKPGFVRSLVLTESLLLALVGGVGGLVLGLLGILGVNAYTQNLANIDAAALTPRLALLAMLISLLLGLLAGLLPARSASRLKITEALGRI